MHKYLTIPRNYFSTIIDRLTRFEPACIRYERVFNDIISKFGNNISLKDLSLEEKISITIEIIHNSINVDNDFLVNDLLTKLEDKYFIFNETSYQYLSARLNINAILSTLDDSQKYPRNVQYLLEYRKNEDLYLNRKKESLLYPVEKIILCEGQTEYILLNTLFNLFDYNLDKSGVIVIEAGGKNQVARKYYSMADYIKLPFFILLDNDAQQIKTIINKKIKDKDKIFLFKSGEFEDIIPVDILINTINYSHPSDLNCSVDDFESNISMVVNLKLIYRKYGFGEFKKSIFAKNLNEYISKFATKNDFINSEIVDFIELVKNN